ncbi:MAG: recombinase family protein [Lachnospiraceae bacterium]|nr:recombinase family protein [Lachnospiraceae bacterium]
MGKLIAYIRVSTQEQNLDRQIAAMKEYGVPAENVFADHGFSGKDFNRPAYQEMLKKIKPGDTLVIDSIDRLGRNFDEVIKEWNIITNEKDAAIVVLDAPFLNTASAANGVTAKMLNSIILTVMSGFAQLEREKIHRRQEEGIAAAKAKGVKFGPPEKEKTPEFFTLMSLYQRGEISARKAAKLLGITHPTFCKWVTAQDTNSAK